MRRALNAVVLIAIALAGSVIARAGVAPPVANPPASATVSDEAEFAIPTRKDRIGRILAPVFVNGRGPYRFMVDTGANSSVISPRLADELGLTPTPNSERATVHGVTGMREAPTVAIASLRADRIERVNLRLPVIDGGVLLDADGVFGADALVGRRLLVDFVDDRIEIAPSGRARPLPGSVKISGTLRFGQLLMTRARVSGVSVAAVIDTGAERTIGNRALLEALRAKRAGMKEFGAVMFSGASGIAMSGELIFTPLVDMGGLQVANIPLVIADAHVFDVWRLKNEPALLVGMDVLGQARAMAIDYRRSEMELVLDPANATAARRKR
jgi:predicted aspartyl protease